MDELCDRIAAGEALRKICDKTEHMPSWQHVLRKLQSHDEWYDQYSRARAIQAELIGDEIVELVRAPLPDDPKLAMAEVGRRRIEADYLDRRVRQMQPRGLRNKVADAPASAAVTLSWAGGSLEVANQQPTPDEAPGKPTAEVVELSSVKK